MHSPSQTQRVYIIGAGVIALHHLRVMAAMQGDFKWEWHVCDVRPAAVENLKAEFPSIHSHTDSSVMLKTESRPTDIVVICTPPVFHAPLSEVALASGRHVLCEKPLFMCDDEADSVERQLASCNGLILSCCSNRFVGNESLSAARKMIADGQIGTLFRMRWISRQHRGRTGIEYQPGSRWFLDRTKNGGGVAMDWGPYDFAALDAILRPRRVTVITCFMGRVETGVRLEPGTVFDVETQVIAQMNYELPGGEIVRVDYERASATHGREESVFEAEGTRGALNLEWVMQTKLQHSHDREGTLISEEVPLGVDTDGVHDRPIQDMIRAVRGEPSLAIANEDALFNFRCLRALYEVAEVGRPVSVERRSITAQGALR